MPRKDHIQWRSEDYILEKLGHLPVQRVGESEEAFNKRLHRKRQWLKGLSDKMPPITLPGAVGCSYNEAAVEAYMAEEEMKARIAA